MEATLSQRTFSNAAEEDHGCLEVERQEGGVHQGPTWSSDGRKLWPMVVGSSGRLAGIGPADAVLHLLGRKARPRLSFRRQKVPEDRGQGASRGQRRRSTHELNNSLYFCSHEGGRFKVEIHVDPMGSLCVNLSPCPPGHGILSWANLTEMTEALFLWSYMRSFSAYRS